MKSMFVRAAAAAVACGVAFAACGSDAPDAGSSTTASTVAPTTAAPTTAAPTTAAPTTETPATTDATDATDAPETTEPETTEPATTEPETTEPAETERTDAPATTAALPPANEVDVALADYSITLPATLPAGLTRFTAANSGADEHHMTLVRLSENQQLGDVLGALSTDPAAAVEAADLFPGPQAVAAGGEQSVTATLEPGEYLALCVIPGADGVPHAAKGMLTQFTVTGEESDESAAPPTPSVVLEEYGFTISDDFTGHGPLRVENKGTLPHELVIYRVADGATYAEAEKFLMDGGVVTADSPVIPSGGITAMSVGRSAGLDLDLVPGQYVFVCFLPGTDHLSHLQHGMMREVEIDQK